MPPRNLTRLERLERRMDPALLPPLEHFVFHGDDPDYWQQFEARCALDPRYQVARRQLMEMANEQDNNH